MTSQKCQDGKIIKRRQYYTIKYGTLNYLALLFKIQMSLGIVKALISNTFLYLNQSNSVLSAVFLTFFSCTCYVGENVYKNGFVSLMCIIFMVYF